MLTRVMRDARSAKVTTGFVTGILLGWFLVGCGDSMPELSPLQADAVILAFGDSLTSGTGAGRGESYPAQLAQLIDRQVVNAGRPGELSAQGLRRLPALLDEYRPDLVILCHGGNDMLQRQDLSTTRANLEAMVELVLAAGAQVLLIAVPQPRLLVRPEPLYASLGKRLAVPVLRDSLSDILTDSALKADPVHPNGAGYTVLARELARLMIRAGAIGPRGSP